MTLGQITEKPKTGNYYAHCFQV